MRNPVACAHRLISKDPEHAHVIRLALIPRGITGYGGDAIPVTELVRGATSCLCCAPGIPPSCVTTYNANASCGGFLSSACGVCASRFLLFVVFSASP